MFTKTSFITLAATAAFITTASARPAAISAAAEPTITAKPENDVYADADDTEYCTTDGVMYPCAWATAGVPDFKSMALDELVARDDEAASIRTSAAVPEASDAVEGDLSNIDQEPEDDPKLVDQDEDDDDDDYDEDEEEEYEEDKNSDPDLSIPAAILNTNSTLLNPRSAGSVKYCSAPGVCATLPADDDCTTFEKGYTSLTFSAGLECSVYAKQDCRKQLFVSKGIVGNVKGFIDTTTDPRAKKHKVGSVMSFKC
ncbi:hypothetical protein KC343_g2953 [Hortaea werneckii]|uniref:Uncharacterized protein n=1 Tax=Hortaea werneckii TaxID=91943 RepID=A0A3M7EFE8_HORWE|nr:hypothetical protein KC352_g8753 [Hortaea werneckii]KAI7570595.1 hypothetical protein KC317_g2323 [Hortaea werneckii]KAI7624687.1 hypothetical protein KC346_g2107 [Hortaea werneckii]KAI7633427.1 hypothetical protein KC343_g2953 [Hortaea werneckii]KAI7678468.1 hypothetical protein KC319_g3328 [Hortaea werneckii]